jgi:hypothetical protein
MMAADVIGFVMEAMEKIVSVVIGMRAEASRQPTASWWINDPRRAMATTAPGIRLSSTSRRSALPIMESRAEENPWVRGSAASSDKDIEALLRELATQQFGAAFARGPDHTSQ